MNYGPNFFITWREGYGDMPDSTFYAMVIQPDGTILMPREEIGTAGAKKF